MRNNPKLWETWDEVIDEVSLGSRWGEFNAIIKVIYNGYGNELDALTCDIIALTNWTDDEGATTRRIEREELLKHVSTEDIAKAEMDWAGYNYDSYAEMVREG